jgi:hypothetical protein
VLVSSLPWSSFIFRDAILKVGREGTAGGLALRLAGGWKGGRAALARRSPRTATRGSVGTSWTEGRQVLVLRLDPLASGLHARLEIRQSGLFSENFYCGEF